MSFGHQRHAVVAWALFLALALAGGCGSSSGRAAESEKAIEGFQKTRSAVVKAQGEIDQTLTALNQLSAGGDLQKSYSNYTGKVKDLEKSRADARKRAEEMRKRVKEYGARWQKEIDSMSDPSIQAGLTQRRDAVKQNFTKVKTAAQSAREAYEPFYKQLKEIERALAVDLTQPNVAAMKPAMDKARNQGQVVKQQLVMLQSELDRISGGMSPGGAVAPKK